MPESVTLTVGGRTMVIETGELAKQANGSALVRYGDQNVVLCAVTASAKPREGIDFFPLTCDFEEKMYAAGKIPGGYIKREGRPSEHAVLSSRQIDRPIRPLFPDGFRNDVRSSRPCCRSIPNSMPTCSACAPPVRRSHSPTFRSTRPLPPCASAAAKKTASIICNPTLAAIQNRRHGHRRRRHRRRRDDGRRRRPRNHRGRFPRRGRVRARANQEDRHSDQSAREKERQEEARVSAAHRQRRARKVGSQDVRKGRRQGDAHRRERRARDGVREVLRRRSAAGEPARRTKTSARCSRIRRPPKTSTRSSSRWKRKSSA